MQEYGIFRAIRMPRDTRVFWSMKAYKSWAMVFRGSGNNLEGLFWDEG